MAPSKKEIEYFKHYSGPLEVRQRTPNRRAGETLTFEVLCTSTNTPVAAADVKMYFDPEGARQTAELLAHYFNLNRIPKA